MASLVAPLVRGSARVTSRRAIALRISRRPVRATLPRLHDHSKGIVGRDDGAHDPAERPDDWWPERPEIPADAPEVRFTVLLASGNSTIDCVGRAGESVETVAKREGLLEGACDGNCQCSTCHVYVPHAADRAALGMPDSVEEFELDMLELAAGYDADPDASRLACQITLEPRLAGLTVRLPSRWTNFMDHIPYE